ncbi:thiamine-phosphate kinase [Rhodococcus xishaensis]|uniref:Thiamine-monophosphate kinase n=1 Tax=Rhodococcus xishaensis TaxID=2487364 RepID=A0A438B368_9NOCA|nr:thiamine-phosphate kinase [Rhodococcus xishaensis]RVW05419.1 thiamine-phosphate kinase [Rhodococcus xishaensis]
MDTSRPQQGHSERTVAQVGEFAVIEQVVARRSQPTTTLVGPGDDAALVQATDGRVAVSADMLVEGRHFRLDWSTPEQVGRKAVAQNGADIAAMGARPTAFLVSLGCPPETPVSVAAGISEGIGLAAEALGAGVVGGDLVQSDHIVVSVTVLGDLEGRAPVLRSGARVGDVVAVAGQLGHSAAGLALLSAGIGVEDTPDTSISALIDSHRVPTPPYDAGVDAARSGVRAMTDISDGLVADLGHVADASGVQMRIDRGLIGLDPALADAAERVGGDPWEWILTGGEDHALAATFASVADLPAGWTVVGDVASGDDSAAVIVDGRPWTASGGWQSFGAG